jgi:hypothetical protein
MIHNRVAAALFTLSFAACGGTSPVMPGGDDDEVTPDAPPAPTGCTSAAECGPEAPICTDEGFCVQCESSADCPAELPVCGGDTCVASCAGDEVSADFITLPTDIIWVVDQSGSMDQETAHVQANINTFASLIDASTIDYRVVMNATTSNSNAICVPGPLGGASCGNNTRFRLVNQRIGSHDGPQRALSRYSSYSDFLRPDSMKHFVFVTDDESGMSAAAFNSGLAALQPAITNFKVHGIYAFGTPTIGCTGAFGTGAADGTVYTSLIAQTGGAAGVICNDDWTQVFDDITAAVVSGSQVSCEITMPAPPRGQELDPSLVNVKYLMGGVAPGTILGQVPSAGDCSTGGGWYYDDNAAPTKITLCPATCSTVQQDSAANVKVEFGCATQIF